MRWKLPRLERPRRRAIEEAFQTAKYYALKNEGGTFPAVTLIFNIGLYLLLAERDIQALKTDALTHPDEWTRKLCARVILLTIYEWDADKIAGRSLRDALDTIGVPEQVKIEMFSVLRRLRVVQDKIRGEFSELRNKTIAHRDANALLVYRAIRNLDVQDVMDVGMEFYSCVGEFMQVLTRVMVHSSTPSALLRQLSAAASTQPTNESV